MKQLLASLLAASLSGVAGAQSSDEVSAERSRIAQQRGDIESAFARDEKACYRRFAVNDCLQDARSRRRESLSELRRQELAINDADRRRKAAERLQELDERALERARSLQPGALDAGRRPPDPGVTPGQASVPHSPRAAPAPKADEAPITPSPAPSSKAPASADPVSMPRFAPAARVPAHRAENVALRQRQQQRLDEAAARKARVAKRLAERDRPARPLPVP